MSFSFVYHVVLFFILSFSSKLMFSFFPISLFGMCRFYLFVNYHCLLQLSTFSFDLCSLLFSIFSMFQHVFFLALVFTVGNVKETWKSFVKLGKANFCELKKKKKKVCEQILHIDHTPIVGAILFSGSRK